MTIVKQDMACYFNKDNVLRDLRSALAVKNGSIFDIVDLDFNYSEFIFFYKLTALFERTERLIAPEKAEEIALLSTLIYLSSKIHCAIEEEPQNQIEFRQKVQFPILVGDLLYGRFFERLIAQNNSSLLEDYLAYLIDFNANRAAKLLAKNLDKQIGEQQYGALAEMTIKLLLSFSVSDHDRGSAWRELAFALGAYMGVLGRVGEVAAFERVRVCAQWVPGVEMVFIEQMKDEARITLEAFSELESLLRSR